VIVAELPSDALYRAAIGTPNQNYYLSYFHRADGRGYPPIAWHWPVLFLGLFWFLYRKQYRFALIVFGLPYLAIVVAGAIESAVPGIGQPLLYTMLLGFAAVWLPLHANGIYYRWVRAEIDAARAAFPGQLQQQLAHLEARGGTNRQLPLIVFSVFLILSMLAGSLVPPVTS
jgi:hypothetical protein